MFRKISLRLLTPNKINLPLSNEYLKNYWTGTWYSLLTLFLAWSFQIFRTRHLVFDFSLLLNYCLILGLKASNAHWLFHKSKLWIFFPVSFQRKQGNYSGRVPFLITLQAWHRCFPVNFVKFLRTPFFTEHLWWRLVATLFHSCFVTIRYFTAKIFNMLQVICSTISMGLNCM